MASPLFRWTFETPQKPVQRSDSEETFIEDAEMHGMDEPNHKDDETTGPVPFQRQVHRSGDLVSGSISQRGVPSSSRQDRPSRDFTKRLDFTPRKNNAVRSSHLFTNEKDNSNIPVENSQAFRWTNDSGSDARRNSNKSTVSSNETFFQGEDKTHHSNFQEDLVPLSSPEILTGLDDSQFNAYPVNPKPQYMSDETVFEMEENLPGMENRCELRHIVTQADLKVYENLTGMSDSQFGAYSSQQFSSDMTFFDGAENRKETNATERPTSQEVITLSERGYPVSGAEQLPCSSTGYSVIGIFSPQEGNYFIGPEASSNTHQNSGTGIAELIQSLAAYPVVPVFKEDSLNDFMEVLNTSSNPNEAVVDEVFNDIAEICSRLQLESTGTDTVSEADLISPEIISDHQESNQTVKNLKRASSPWIGGENKKRRTAPQFSKPDMYFYKYGKPKKKSLTPRHSMTLRCKKVLSEDIVKSATPTPKSGSCQSEKRLSQRKKAKSHLHDDYTNQSNLKSMRPSPEVSNIKQRKTTSQHVKVFEETASCVKQKRGRQKKKVECDSESFEQHSTAADSGKRRSTDERLLRERGCLQPDGKRCLGTPQKMHPGKTIGKTKNTIEDSFRVQLVQDETLLRNIRKQLIDIICDETPISKEDLESMIRDITEKQRRILRWKNLHVGKGDRKISCQIKELEVLCDNLNYQIKTLMASSSLAEDRCVPPSETNYDVSKCNDIGSPVETRRQSPELRPQNVFGKSFQTKPGVVSKKSNIKGNVTKTPGRKKTSPKKPVVNAGKQHPEFSGSEESSATPVPDPNYSVSQRSNFVNHNPTPEQRRQNVSLTSSKKNSEAVSKKRNPLGDITNRDQGKKATQAQQKQIVNKTPALFRVVNDGFRKVEPSRLPPIKFTSSQDLRKYTLIEQTISGSLRKEGNFGFVEPTEAAFATKSEKTFVDVGVNTDFVEIRDPKRSFVDRSTNTDPEDFERGKCKVLVDCGTNTDFDYNAVGSWTVPKSANKEIIQPKIDWKSIKYVWRPKPEDYLPCSYDLWNLPDRSKDPNARLPQELLDDLTWSD